MDRRLHPTLDQEIVDFLRQRSAPTKAAGLATMYNKKHGPWSVSGRKVAGRLRVLERAGLVRKASLGGAWEVTP